MSNRSATHSTFVIERNYHASPARVFAAWADLNTKGQWFGPGGEHEHELEFREGGREHFEAAVEGTSTLMELAPMLGSRRRSR